MKQEVGVLIIAPLGGLATSSTLEVDHLAEGVCSIKSDQVTKTPLPPTYNKSCRVLTMFLLPVENRTASSMVPGAGTSRKHGRLLGSDELSSVTTTLAIYVSAS